MAIKPLSFALALSSSFVLSLLLILAVFGAERRAEEHSVTVKSGMLPIILSAPHSGRELIPGVGTRRGIGVAQFTTGRDHNTGELAERIATKLEAALGAKPFLVIARFDRKFVDANRPSEGAYESEAARPHYEAYHRVLAKYCEQVRGRWGHGLLLDIHGQNAEVEAIFRGTNNLKSVTDLERRYGNAALSGPKSILGLLERRGYKIIPANNGGGEREQRYTGGYTTRKYGSHHANGIDAIQLEFGTHLRSRAQLERTANNVASAVAVFAGEYLPLERIPAAKGE